MLTGKWIAIGLLALGALGPLLASAAGLMPETKRVHVRMDTAAWVHRRGWVVSRYSTGKVGCDSTHAGLQPTIRFVEISHDGIVGPLQTSGCGGMDGSLSLDPRKPATWSVPRTGDHEFAINFANREFKPDEPWIGSFVHFTVELPTSDLDPNEEVVVAFLDRKWDPDLTTSSATRSLVLAKFIADPEERTWRLQAFKPARLRPSRSGANGDTIDVLLPRPPRSAGMAVRPRRVQPRLIRANRNLDGKLWVEYTVPSPGGTVRVQVLDRQGLERFRHEYVVTTPGVYGVEWPQSRRDPPPPPGHYRVLVEIAGHRMEAECDL